MKKTDLKKLIITLTVIMLLDAICIKSLAATSEKNADESTYKGTINTDMYEMNIIQSTSGQNYISGKIGIAEWVNNQCLTPSTLPKITLKSTDGKYSGSAYIDYLGGIEYYFDKNIENVDTNKEYYLEVELTNSNNTASKEEQTQKAKIGKNKQIGKCTNGNFVKVENNDITISPKYKGTINTDLYKIDIIQSTAGKNYISGRIGIAEWVDNQCLTPSKLPQITLKSTDGKYSESTYIDYLGGIEYYFDKNIENLDINKKYYLEIKLTNSNNIASKEEQMQKAKMGKNGLIGQETNGITVNIENGNIVLENSKIYKGSINTELYQLQIIQSTAGANYISGKIGIAEWVNGNCLTPKGMPKITLKSTDGTYSESTYIDYLGGIEYYFDKNIENIDTNKQYFLEVELTGKNNVSSKNDKVQKTSLEKYELIGYCTNGKVLEVKNGYINVSIKYKGVINTDLYRIGVIQSTAGENYISGRIYIAEWIDNECLKPSMMPTITLKSTDGTYSENAYIDYLGGIEYYFDKNIEKIDISKTYYLEVNLTNPNNIASKAEQMQKAKIRQNGVVGKCTNGNFVKIAESNITLKYGNFDVNIDEAKYPGIKNLIYTLAEAHPTWNFEILYTGLDWNTAVSAEYYGDNKRRNLISSYEYKGDWIASDAYSSGGWYSASYNAIAYFMDVRNFVSENYVFQFLDLNGYDWESVSVNEIANQTKGTFLQNYVNDVNNACISQNVNPYYVLARLFQEQGKKGTAIGTGMPGGDGKTYYNPFNIGAEVGNDYNTALAKAKEKGWDSMEKAIAGGIDFLKARWLNNYQNTLYQNKFDIDSRNGTELYTHQYMQNLSAAYSEAKILRGCYVSSNKLEGNFTFIIPVYENMPETACQAPSGNSTDNSVSVLGPKDVKVVNVSSTLNIREQSNTKSNIIAKLPAETKLLSVKRNVNGNWHQVVLDDGTIGYASGEYLEFIDDRTNCNITKKVIASGGLNMRTGPSTSLDIIQNIPENSTVTVINSEMYNKDGYIWSRIVTSSGTQGFVANNYLK